MRRKFAIQARNLAKGACEERKSTLRPSQGFILLGVRVMFLRAGCPANGIRALGAEADRRPTPTESRPRRWTISQRLIRRDFESPARAGRKILTRTRSKTLVESIQSLCYTLTHSQ